MTFQKKNVKVCCHKYRFILQISNKSLLSENEYFNSVQTYAGKLLIWLLKAS